MTLVSVAIGNFLYFFFIILLILAIWVLLLFGRKFGKSFSSKMIITLCWVNFALHYVKQIFPGYIDDFPYSLAESTFVNLCAVLIIVAPFIFLYGGDYAKDYFVVVGAISGIAVFLYPSTALHTPLDTIEGLMEVLRFYLCHAILVITAVLTLLLGFHKLDYHRLWALPLFFMGFEAIIVANEAVLKLTGLVDMSWGEFWSRNYRNPSLAFGPGVSYDSTFLGNLYWVVPSFLRYTDSEGMGQFVPVLWMAVPLYLFGVPLGFLLELPFEYRHVKLDGVTCAQKWRMRRSERKQG